MYFPWPLQAERSGHFKWLLGGVPEGSPTSTGGFVCVMYVCVMCVCVLPKKKTTGDGYSILQNSTQAYMGTKFANLS
jgi:hypothetical protein